MSAPKKESPLGKPTAIDYVVMIGGPVAFLAIAIWGILWMLGPAPPRNPVSLLKKGVVKTGMTPAEVVGQVGQPKSIEPRAGGGFTYRYHRGTAEPFVEEDAYIDFSMNETVVNVSFERTAVRPPGE
jgi:hypothetical protein